MKSKSNLLGFLLIALGLIFFISKQFFGFEIFHFTGNDFWVLIVLFIGITFEMIYFMTGRIPGFLIPGGILTVIGLLFFFEVGTYWRFAAYTWPVYIFAVAFGLIQFYIMGGRAKGVLIASGILGAVAAVSSLLIVIKVLFNSMAITNFVIPAILVIAGIVLITGRNTRKEF